MKHSNLLAAVLLAVLATSCNEADVSERDRAINRWMVDTLKSDAVENAVVAQRTLFPYHFVEGSAKLTSLGRRDVLILAGHYRRAPGELRVRRGEAEDELYDARVAEVRDVLADAAVDLDRMSITDELPGGPGAASDRVRWILEQEREVSGPGAQPTGGGAGARGGGYGGTSMSGTGGTRR